MNSKDPFNGLNVEQIANLPEDRFRYYIAHQLSKNETTHKDMCRKIDALVRRPERVLAKIAVASSVIASILGSIAILITIT